MTADPTPLPNKRLSAQSSTLLIEYMAEGMKHGIELQEVFRALADDLTDRRLQVVATNLAEKIEAGATPAKAFQSLDTALPRHLRRALQIGAETGNLAGILTGLAENEVAQKKMRRAMFSVLAYPLLVLLLLSLVLAILTTTVIPSFAEIYEDFGLYLPDMTEWLLAVSKYFPTFLSYSLAVGALCVLANWVPGCRRLAHWIRTTIPLFGRAWLWSGHHEFATFMATLTEQKNTTLDALTCTADSLRDRNLARATRLAYERCEQGQTLGQSLSNSLHFDPTLTALVRWGETNQALPQAFRDAARTYEQQIDSYILFLRRVLPSLMLATVIFVLFFTTIALFIPLVELVNGLTY